jgi:hypothetical protein
MTGVPVTSPSGLRLRESGAGEAKSTSKWHQMGGVFVAHKVKSTPKMEAAPDPPDEDRGAT